MYFEIHKKIMDACKYIQTCIFGSLGSSPAFLHELRMFHAKHNLIQIYLRARWKR